MAAPSLVLSLLLLLGPLPACFRGATFLDELDGSGEAEAPSPSPPAASTVVPSLPPGPGPPTSLLDGLAHFFREQALLVAVVGALALLLLVLACAAVVCRQQRANAAYYPSGFPKKKYVDSSDPAGGPRAFSELPDGSGSCARPGDALDSSRQLQADILAATQSLRSPPRARDGEPQEPCLAPTEGSPEAGQDPEDLQEAPSSVQESGETEEAPPNPCACSTVTSST